MSRALAMEEQMIRVDEFEPFGSPVNSVVLIPCK